MSLLSQTIQFQPKTPVEKFVHKAMHIWSQRAPEEAYDVLSPDLVEHAWGVTGVKEIQEICYAMHDAFTNYHLKVDGIISEGDLATECKISVRFVATGKWVNQYCGVEPNNEDVTFPGILNWVVREGKVCESWIYQSYASCPELGYAVLKLSKESGVFC